MRKSRAGEGSSGDEGLGVPLLSQSRPNLFEGQDAGIKVAKPLSERLPFRRRAKQDVKYGPARTVFFNYDDQNTAEAVAHKYASNVVVTSTYSLLSFLPMNMFEQFQKAANFYFLCVVILQWIPAISPVSPLGSTGALLFVVAVSAIRAAVEDIRRHRDDHVVNNTPCSVLRGNDFADGVPWKDLRVGDIVRVEGNAFFPADLLLLNSSEPNGLAFVNTMNLDGETNTKPKQAPGPLHRFHSPMELASIAGRLKSEGVNKNLDAYTGTLEMEGEAPVALDNRNILYRGCQLVTAKYCYGLVIFTGRETKLMKNSIKVRLKRTKLDKLLNRAILLVLGMLFLVCLIGFIGMAANVSDNLQHDYLQWSQSWLVAGLLNFLTYLVLFSGMVPISLYVSVEMVKVVQAILIDSDVEMYHERSDTPAKAKTSALSEELGQIDYIFSDKTGTLTRNEMEFKKCCVGGRSYGLLDDEPTFRNVAPVSTADPAFGFRDAELEGDLRSGPNAAALQAFFSALAVCHTVLVEANRGRYAYSAESPDEAALVDAASQMGFIFAERVTTNEGSFIGVKKAGFGGDRQSARREECRYQLLQVIEFNSTRKRMSVVVREAFGSRRLLVLCKGADNVITGLLAAGQDELLATTAARVSEYAQVGLRTLFVASRVLDERWYASWAQRYLVASTAMENREQLVAEVCVDVERELVLLGATAIEDKLQEGVPETIFNLSESGIKIWVLTGDKKDTAINIGFSCHLLQPHYKLIVIDAADWHQTQLQLRDALELYIRAPNRSPETVFALVIEGQTLHHALEPENRLHLLAVATQCRAVICCRVSPKQKAEVVELVKKTLRKTCLSIGDGANDVSMIREAHIGVGISGHEGRQAVMASDYAIAQFRFLETLLLIHGRYSYKRITMLVKYAFYKNYVYAMVHIFFNAYAKFSGQTLYDTWMLAFYNLIFTSLPVLFFSVLERDVGKRTVRTLPKLYETGLLAQEFNLPIFLSWLARGFVEAAIIFYVCMAATGDDVLLANGTNAGLWVMGVTAFTACICVVTGKLALYVSNWTIYQAAVMVGSIAVWFVYLLLYGAVLSSGDLVGLPLVILTLPSFWLSVVLCMLFCLLPEFLWLVARRWLWPENFHIAQYLEGETRRIAAYMGRAKPVPKRLLKNVTVLEMARSLEGIDPATIYHGFAYSGTAGGRATLQLATNGKF